MKGRRRCDDDGYVLINALIIVAALSVMALGTLDRSVERRIEIAASTDGAALVLMTDAGVRYAAALLEADLHADDSLDHAGEPWALAGRMIEVDRGTVEVTVRDAQALFNLNLLAGEHRRTAAAVLARLMLAENLDPEVLQGLRSHFEPISARAPAGAPGRDIGPAWFEPGDLTHVTDIGALPAVGPQFAADLAPFVETLPRTHRVNVNTASAETLAAATGLAPAPLQTLIALRARQPFATLAAFENAVAGVVGDTTGTAELSGLLGVRSHWFDVETIVRLGDLTLRHRARLFRDPETGRVRLYFQQWTGS